MGYISVRRVMANFVLKFAIFRYHGNRVGLSNFFTYTGLLAVPDNPTWNQKLRLYLAQNRSYDCLNIFHYGNRNFFRIFTKNWVNIKFYFSNPQKALPCAEPRQLTIKRKSLRCRVGGR